ncbi:hypothetical protein GDO81_018983, partial [Engystomops pustulosus]
RLSQSEKYGLLEAQVLMSNQFKDYERQRGFLVQILGPAATIWASEKMQRAISSPDEMISYLGAKVLRGEEEDDEDPSRLNRSQLSFCLHTMEAVLRRSRWPSKLEVAKSKGFVVGYTSSGAAIYRNPCCEEILKHLDSLLSLVR